MTESPTTTPARLMIAAITLAITACGVWHAPTASPALTQEPTRRLWIEDHDRSVTPLVIKGRPARFILDTGIGMPAVLFEPALRRFNVALTEAPEAGPRPGTVTLVTTDPLPVAFFGRDTEISFAVVPLPSFVNPKLDGVGDGAIGWPAISHHPWILDTANNVFSPLQEISEEMKSGQRFELTEHRVLVIKTSLSEKNTQIYIDTGSASGIKLPPAEWNKWKKENPHAPITLSMSYFIGEGFRAREESMATEFKLGPLTLRHVPIGEASLSEHIKEDSGDDTVISVGLRALDTFALILDPDNKLAYAHPNSGGVVPKHNRFGIAFSEVGDNLVAQVAPRSPAAEAGLQTGDLLVEVDGRTFANWRESPRAMDALNLSAPAGTTKKFVIKRGGIRKAYSIIARDLLF